MQVEAKVTSLLDENRELEENEAVAEALYKTQLQQVKQQARDAMDFVAKTQAELQASKARACDLEELLEASEARGTHLELLLLQAAQTANKEEREVMILHDACLKNLTDAVGWQALEQLQLQLVQAKKAANRQQTEVTSNIDSVQTHPGDFYITGIGASSSTGSCSQHCDGGSQNRSSTPGANRPCVIRCKIGSRSHISHVSWI